MTEKTILITGVAGFIGSHLAERFVRQGHRVIGIDNFLTGAEENLSPVKGERNFVVIRHNMSQPLEIPEPVHFVLHFASPASPADYLNFPIQTLKVGSLGTHNTLGLAKAKRAVFLLASTSEVYGDPLVSPQPEEYWGNVNPLGPRGVYDEAKRFAEALTMAYHQVHSMDTKIARIFNTYGPRMRLNDGRAIPNFIAQALRGEEITVYGDGSQTRSFCYIEDLAGGIEKLLFSTVQGAVNLGNPAEMTVLELAKRVIELTGSQSRIAFKPLPQDDPKQRCPDIRKAKAKLGWEPKIGLETGLSRTIGYFKTVLSLKKEGSGAGR
jgi:dTDP-glucose 4,6-dehydratase